MFMGRYEHSIDAKNRLIVPAKYRDELGSSFVVTAGLDGCLYILSMESFAELAQELKSLPLTDRDSRALLRHLVANASTCEFDKQGRVLLSAAQKEHAGIVKDAVFLGMIDKIEIWGKEKYEAVENGVDIEAIEQHLAERGLSI